MLAGSSQSVNPGPAEATASLECNQMPILGSHNRPTKPYIWGLGPENGILTSPAGNSDAQSHLRARVITLWIHQEGQLS